MTAKRFYPSFETRAMTAWKRSIACPVCGKTVAASALFDHAEKHALELGAVLVDKRFNVWKLPDNRYAAGCGLTLLNALARL